MIYSFKLGKQTLEKAINMCSGKKDSLKKQESVAKSLQIHLNNFVTNLY